MGQSSTFCQSGRNTLKKKVKLAVMSLIQGKSASLFATRYRQKLVKKFMGTSRSITCNRVQIKCRGLLGNTSPGPKSK